MDKDDLAYLKDPKRWFRDLICPLKRPKPNHLSDLALAVDLGEGKLGLLEGVDLFTVEIDDLDRAVEVTAEEIINQGWLVD